MNVRTLLVVCGAIAMVVALTTGTSGFSSATADRSVTVSVAEDDTALLGVERSLSGVTNGTTNLTVAVTNQFSDTSFTNVEVRVGDRSTSLATTTGLTPGDRETVTFTSVSCDETIRLTATGPAVTVTLTRSVSCQ
ncbi:hypothetical protein [Salinibaculum salinum]|uniref:hypothetical protein n=1 Tax=Salinibaculum salinum TaxID=3131996 RepID=UPI0030EB7E3F